LIKLFNMEKLTKVICENYNINTLELFSNKRNSNVVKARQMFIYFAYNYYKKNVSEISKKLKKNHATVIYSINKINSEMNIYKDIINKIGVILKDLNSFLIPNDVDLLQMTNNYSKSFI